MSAADLSFRPCGQCWAIIGVTGPDGSGGTLTVDRAERHARWHQQQAAGIAAEVARQLDELRGTLRRESMASRARC